jgi:hypothetical protein
MAVNSLNHLLLTIFTIKINIFTYLRFQVINMKILEDNHSPDLPTASLPRANVIKMPS